MNTLVTLIFLSVSAYGMSQTKTTTTNNGATPQPQQLQNNGLNNTRSNKEQRYAPAEPAPGSAAPAPAALPDTTRVKPETSAGKPPVRDMVLTRRND